MSRGRMRSRFAVVILLSFTAAASAADRGGAFWIARARSIIIAHHLLSRADLRCTGLVYGVESTPAMAGITAVEKHGGRCGGEPTTSPRMFSMQIDKVTGQAKWDRDTGDFEMKPIP